MRHNEDRELDIRLAELQADIQICLAACFGFLAVFAALIIGFEQIYFALPAEQNLVKLTFVIFITLASVVLVVVVTFFIRKMQNARKQIEELRKQYVW